MDIIDGDSGERVGRQVLVAKTISQSRKEWRISWLSGRSEIITRGQLQALVLMTQGRLLVATWLPMEFIIDC